MNKTLLEAAGKGRNGDDMLMHVSRGEVMGLAKLAQDMGAEMTMNPDTGLPEAFLFAPMLAGVLAPSLMPGMGAIGTGLMAGGLGAAEAAARGMDNPIEQGLFSGLTAGGMSALGGAMSGAAPGATAAPGAAGAPPVPGASSMASGAATSAGAPPLPAAATSAGAPPISGASSMASGAATSAGAPPLPASASPVASTATQQSGGLASLKNNISDIGSDITGRFSKMGAGAEAIGKSPEGWGGFMKSNLPAIGAVGAGLMGQADLATSQGMREERDADKRERKTERRISRDMIEGAYDRAGRSMPTGRSGQTRFRNYAAGGMVGDNYYKCGGQVKHMAQGGLASIAPAGGIGGMGDMGNMGGVGPTSGYLGGPTDGMGDAIPAAINGSQPAQLSDGEFILPADVVSHLGNGSSNAGAQQLYDMMGRIRQARTGTAGQGNEISPNSYMPA